MIIATNISKKFDKVEAVVDITAEIKESQVFGLIGTNGAGKSTFLRMISGVIKPDIGTVTIDGLDVFENEQAKREFFYISDDQFFFLNANPIDMANYYKNIFRQFNLVKFNDLMKKFDLPQTEKSELIQKVWKNNFLLFLVFQLTQNTFYAMKHSTDSIL